VANGPNIFQMLLVVIKANVFPYFALTFPELALMLINLVYASDMCCLVC